jgi:unsaturated rhamnogalacturonyl hydrolase
MLPRRTFLKTIPAGVILASAPAIITGCSKNEQEQSIIQKVKMAMLSMQRASWEHGVAMQAIWELGYYNMSYLMSKEAVLRQANDGRLSVLYTDNGVTDPAASGEVVLEMARLYNDETLLKAHEQMLDYLINRAPKTAEGILHHTINAPEIWVDSFYMAPPYLCAAGYHAEAMKQAEGFRQALWKPEQQLYAHRWHAGEKHFINEKCWGVGNGWALAAMARMIDLLPGNMQNEREQLINFATEHLEACLRYLRPDGLFHNIMDDPDSFVETNLSQMVAYSIYRGIHSEWLGKELLKTANLMRNAAHSKVDELGFVQGVCGAPWFDQPGSATEGQAFFLLMEAAHQKIM